MAPTPRVTIKRAVLRLGGEHVLVRVSGTAAGDAGQQWPVTVTVTNASGDLLGQVRALIACQCSAACLL